MFKGFENWQMGLLGEKLGHSFSALIHPKIGDYQYQLYEVAPEKLGGFLQNSNFAGLNVTIPYKKQVMEYLDDIAPMAKKIGAVNTIKKMPNGSLIGYNTDYDGFKYLLQNNKVVIKDKKVLILGSGGAAVMVSAVLEELGAKEIVMISRKGENNYQNIHKHYDAQAIINATPVGMYPNNYQAPLDISHFKACESVVDLIYNPLRTKLVTEAKMQGINAVGGLEMLVAQAAVSASIWCEREIEAEEIEKIITWLNKKMENIVLIGMPGCGKTTIAQKLSALLDKEAVDLDEMFSAHFHQTPEEVINNEGEEVFRQMEHEITKLAGKRSGIIIAAGGGTVTRRENYFPLKQNGVIVYLKRDLAKLPKEGRPLSQRNDLAELYQKRKSDYKYFADLTLAMTDDAEDNLRRLLPMLAE